MLKGGVEKWARLLHQGHGPAPGLGVGGETVCREGIGDRVQGRPERPLPFSYSHGCRQFAPVGETDPLGHLLGGLLRYQGQRPPQQRDK